MLQLKKKNIDAAVWGMPSQRMTLVLVTPDPIPDRTTGILPSTMMGEEFTGGMGLTLSRDQRGLGVCIQNPDLDIKPSSIQALSALLEGGEGAFNLAAANAAKKLAYSIIRDLFANPARVVPTIKLAFKSAENGRNAPKILRVEMVMRGVPSGHPMWHYDAL